MQNINSLYIHFPHCRHLCNYCDFYKTKIDVEDKDFEEFHSFLDQSYQVHEQLLSQNSKKMNKLDTLYIGGGTPSLWGIEGAAFFKEFLKRNEISLNDSCEFTLEVNPGTWSEDVIDAWMEAGVNRFSIGLQSLNENFLKTLDRVHSREESLRTLNFFNSLGVNYSVDFMLGLPHSEIDLRDIESELEEVLSFNPQHLSLYILTVKQQYKHFDSLPDDEFIEKEYLKTAKILRAQGLKHYEVSNFALPGKESKHNIEYWKSESVAALGPSATGFLNLGDKAIRYKWKTSNPELQLETLNSKKLRLEYFYLILRCNEGFNWREFFDSTDHDKFESLILKWSQRQLIESSEPLRLNSKGYLILDSLIDEVFSLALAI